VPSGAKIEQPEPATSSFPIHLEDVFSVQDVERFVLASVAMERWTALRRSDSLHDGIVPIGIVASELYEDQITKDVQRAGASRLSGLQQ
jgi:hypothetical protein